MSSFGVHKSWIILSLVLASMTMLFLASTAAMIYLQVHLDLKSIRIPWLFYTNTLILIWSSIILRRIDIHQANTHRIRRICKQVLWLGIIFLTLQTLAWYQLLSNSILINSDRMSSFLYFISALHFVHVLGGLPFLFFYYRKLSTLKTNNMEELSSENKLTFSLLRTYWHFLDILWIYLVLFLFILTQVL